MLEHCTPRCQLQVLTMPTDTPTARIYTRAHTLHALSKLYTYKSKTRAHTRLLCPNCSYSIDSYCVIIADDLYLPIYLCTWTEGTYKHMASCTCGQYKPVLSPAYIRHDGPASLRHKFFFDVGKERDRKL